METILNYTLWDDILNFDELINDFEFSRKVKASPATEIVQFDND
jgi:hypothetical protein